MQANLTNRMLRVERNANNEQEREQSYPAWQHRPGTGDEDSRHGTMLTTASLATNERKKVPNTDKWEDHAEWHSLVFFGRTAEIARDYLRKGSKCYVEGHLRTTSWKTIIK